MINRHWSKLFCIALLVTFYVVVNLTRPLIPIDETRYLTVAWEFFARGEWILPTLNFEPYSHKPPMLFWLINIMWRVFGPDTLWGARAVPLLASILTVCLTRRLAHILWPAPDDARAVAAPLLLLTLPFFLLYSSLVMFDTLLTVAVLIGIYALLQFYQTSKRRYWLLLGLAFGLGGLIKGPVILLHLVPVILLFPLWRDKNKSENVVWAEGTFFALLIGITITLAWAIPAAALGGPEYERMIFWGQSAGRMVQSFDHAKPFWFYLVLAPAALLPWMMILARVPATPRQSIKEMWAARTWQTRFLICWMVPVFVAFSMISGKQIHYLFPILPAAALLMSHWFVSYARRLSPTKMYLWMISPGLFAIIALQLVEWVESVFDHDGLSNFAIQINSTHSGVGLVAILLSGIIAFGLKFYQNRLPSFAGLYAAALAGLILLSSIHIAGAPLLKKYYDLAPLGQEVRNAIAFGAPVAVTPKWEGEFGYLARLTRKIDVLDNNNKAIPWLRSHKSGIVIMRHSAHEPPYGTRIVYTQPYRSPDRIISIITNKK